MNALDWTIRRVHTGRLSEALHRRYQVPFVFTFIENSSVGQRYLDEVSELWQTRIGDTGQAAKAIGLLCPAYVTSFHTFSQKFQSKTSSDYQLYQESLVNSLGNEAKILIPRCQGTSVAAQTPMSNAQNLTPRQVICQELASELVNLRVSNIYDLSSV
jgi:hypothetical protein